jgi:hypothetical protein
MPRKIRIDMTGVRHGRLVGIGYSHNHNGHAHWLFLCDCGNEVTVNGAAVRAGTTASCGCLHREISAERLIVHGRRAQKRHDPTYRAWQAMNDSCANPLSPKFRHCGALGIEVCSVWQSDFEAFLADMGERPEGTILARIGGFGHFEPANCRWIATRSRSRRAIDGWRRQSDRKRTKEEAESPLPTERVAVAAASVT